MRRKSRNEDLEVGNDRLPSRTLGMRMDGRDYTDQRDSVGVTNLMGEIVAVYVKTAGYT
jgi:hypothetical protein